MYVFYEVFFFSFSGEISKYYDEQKLLVKHTRFTVT